MISATQEAEIGYYSSRLGHTKVSKILPRKQARMLALAYNLSYSGGRNRRINTQGWPGQKWENLTEKQTKSQRAGDVT
jgi:hypothetical protein